MKKLATLTFLSLFTLIGCKGEGRGGKEVFGISSVGKLNEELIANIDVRYIEYDDRVVFTPKVAGSPISILGVNLNAENVSHEKIGQICSLLGFSRPEKTFYKADDYKQYHSLLGQSERTELNSYSLGRANHYIPRLSFDAMENTTGSSFFNYIPSMILSFFDGYQSEQKYINRLECEGVTGLHYNASGLLNEETFFLDLIYNSYGLITDLENNDITKTKKYLISSGRDAWKTMGSLNFYLLQDNELLETAKKGAREYCVQQNYSDALIFNFDYVSLRSLDHTVEIYKYSDGGGWYRSTIPSTDHIYEDADFIYQAPMIFIENIICF